jgi:tetratricopeptide (TPR) repeat protein
MRYYSALIHQDTGSAFGLTFPDLPGCHAAADSWDAIPAAATEGGLVRRRAVEAAKAARFAPDDQGFIPLPMPAGAPSNRVVIFLPKEGSKAAEQRTRELEKALTMSSRAIALTDNNPTYLDTHAWVLFKLGRTDEARKILQKAVALDGQKSPELMVHYGDILHLLGEQFMAEIYWRRALEKGYDARQIEQRLKQPAVKKPEPKE